MLFQGFETFDLVVGDVNIHFVRRGQGPALLLLHGIPQTHVMWHKVAPALAEHFTVIAADLRGQGDSSKPRDAGDHSTYSNRRMARDQVELMSVLGFEDFYLAGHDIGARVAHRMTLDCPECVSKVAFLDILPTLELYEHMNRDFALLYWSNFFLAQPPDLPERMIGSDPAFYVERDLFDFVDDDRDKMEVFIEEALAEYKRCLANRDAIHALCEDARASFSVDHDHDLADRYKKIGCPALVLWGARGAMERCFDVMGVWQERASQLSGRALDAGHYLAEEQPGQTIHELLKFFK
jgi:haloacetate dehalogenase